MRYCRLDRSEKTHLVDPDNPRKFKQNGGGVLLAVRVDADIESKLVKSNCRAEILSVKLDFGSNNVICFSRSAIGLGPWGPPINKFSIKSFNSWVPLGLGLWLK